MITSMPGVITRIACRTGKLYLCSHFLEICVITLAIQVSGSPAVSAQPTLQSIRVALVQDDPQVQLQIHGGFLMRSADGANVHEGRRLEEVTVRAESNGLVIGAQVFPFAGLRIEPKRDAMISLNGKRVRGTLEILSQQDQTLLVINHVALEDYLRSVLSKEAPDYWPIEVLKAIAIVARTYAIHRMFLKEDRLFDVTGNVLSQEYGGRNSEKARTSRAVKATRGQILMHEGGLFSTFYHSTCGGRAENGGVMGSEHNVSPLKGGRVCRFCTASPFFNWKRRLTSADVAWALKKDDQGSVGTVQDMRVTQKTSTGRVSEVTIIGSKGKKKMKGYDFRALFGFESIRSLAFTISWGDNAYVIQGNGWGHGVGLCQWGAAELARRGYNAKAILQFYYTGTELASVSSLYNQRVRVIGGGS